MLRRVLSSRWLRALVGLGLLAFIVSRADMAELAQLLARGHSEQLLIGLALLLLANPGLQALRLHVLVARYTRRLAATFRIFFVSAFFNTLLPSNVGGDAIRLLELRRHHADNWGGPFALLLLHRVSGMAVLLIGAAFCAVSSWGRLKGVLAAAHVETQLPVKALWLVLAGIAVAALVWLRLSAKVRERAAAMAQKFAGDCARALLQLGTGAALRLLLLTVAFHAMRAVAFALLVQFGGQAIAMSDVVLVLAVSAIAGVVPITVGGLGLVEGAIALMLGLFGVSGGAGLIVAFANRLAMLICAGAGGVVYLAGKGAGAGAAVEPVERA